MVTREDNDLLTRVEGDWPMGGIMRRHWLPACLSEEVAEPDGAPVRTRMLGEDLVVFRDTKGGSAFSASTACIAARRSRSGATKNAACAASITAGSSTWTATSSIRRASPKAGA